MLVRFEDRIDCLKMNRDPKNKNKNVYRGPFFLPIFLIYIKKIEKLWFSTLIFILVSLTQYIHWKTMHNIHVFGCLFII